jgi:ribosomal protein S18 acetylase RimI-like enzyme
MHSITLAEGSHAETIASFDHRAQYDNKRVAFIRRSIANRNCHVVSVGGKAIGYAVLEYSFFENGFISMLYVQQEYRRRGVGEELMHYLEGLCRTPKLFTSTNLSNTAMQSLLAKLGYVLSGVIENLDESDPELIYFKCPKQQAF